MRQTQVKTGRGSKGRSVAERYSAGKREGSSSFNLVDNRVESTQIRKLQMMADSSPKTAATAVLQAMADRSPDAAAQRKLRQGFTGGALQRMDEEEALQPKSVPSLMQRAGMDEEDPLQGKFPLQRVDEEEEALQPKSVPSLIQRAGLDEEEPLQGKATPIQKKKNETGMPDHLKSGVENLSGLAMDDVRVHYNSAKPAAVQALAYAQGTEIHVGPGQEKHLAHEAWHVVQQKQGRVKPTVQLAGTAVNDDKVLEQEADSMGARALNTSAPLEERDQNIESGVAAKIVSQNKLRTLHAFKSSSSGARHNEPKIIHPSIGGVVQRADWYEYGAANTTPHIHSYSGGDCHLKVAGGNRYDLIKKGRRVKQTSLNDAFDKVRDDYPESDNVVRVGLLAKMKSLLRDTPKHKSDE